MRNRLFHIIFIFCSLIIFCTKNRPHQYSSFSIIPGTFVYSIIEHNDSIYFSTQKGSICRFHPAHSDSVTCIRHSYARPFRTLASKQSGQLFASSYETGVYTVQGDTLSLLPHLFRQAWAMKIDSIDNIWLAGRSGVYKEDGDTLLRITNLHEAYDIDFFNGYLVVAHKHGITFYDSASGSVYKTYCNGTICWSLDVFDTLLVAGGVEVCALITNKQCTVIPLKPRYTIPWAAAMDTSGTIFLATQKGLYSIKQNTYKARCIAYNGKCIKSVLVDSRNRIWIGTYFK